MNQVQAHGTQSTCCTCVFNSAARLFSKTNYFHTWTAVELSLQRLPYKRRVSRQRNILSSRSTRNSWPTFLIPEYLLGMRRIRGMEQVSSQLLTPEFLSATQIDLNLRMGVPPQISESIVKMLFSRHRYSVLYWETFFFFLSIESFSNSCSKFVILFSTRLFLRSIFLARGFHRVSAGPSVGKVQN